MTPRPTASLFVFGLLLTVSGARPLGAPADPDWSRFRGPNGTGVSSSAGLPTEFGPDRNVLWKTAVPTGHSSPVLTRSRIFLTAHDHDTLLVLGLDRATGRELWRRQVPRTRKGRLDGPNGPASPSPVTDGERVYAFFQDFGLMALSTEGKELWRLPLGPFNQYYGFGASPILVDGTVILAVDQDSGSYLLGVDATFGKGQLQGRPSRRDLRIFNADGLSAEGGTDAGADPRVVPALRL